MVASLNNKLLKDWRISMTDYKKNLNEYLKRIDEVIACGKYKDNWESLMNHKVPDWYRNSKFGIFIHWGLYTVPAYATEKYSMRMYWENDAAMKNKGTLSVHDYHVKNYGDPAIFGYKDFLPLFKAEKFDAKEWSHLFKRAGARFVMPVAEHHDGFQMYDSQLSEWCATLKGPKRDIVGEIKEAVEADGMVFTASSHRIEHYWFFAGAKGKAPKEDLEYPGMYWPAADPPQPNKKRIWPEVDQLFMEDWLARSCEIVDKYHPKIVYFDWWTHILAARPYTKKFAAYYYNRALEWGEEVTINYKNDSFPQTVAVKDLERGQLSDISPYFWQNDTCIAYNSWSYVAGLIYKTPEVIIQELIDIVSKNGSLLLNVTPKEDGTFPEEQIHILNVIGDWMKVNGEGIYDTYPWRWYGEGPNKLVEGQFMEAERESYTENDFRFTYKDGCLYIFAMKWPKDGVVKIHTLGEMVGRFNAYIKKSEILGSGACKHVWSDEYLTINAPDVQSELPVCIKLYLE